MEKDNRNILRGKGKFLNIVTDMTSLVSISSVHNISYPYP